MLTGPVTILQWSFVRDDQPRAATCRQIALAIRDEVSDLEAAGIAHDPDRRAGAARGPAAAPRRLDGLSRLGGRVLPARRVAASRDDTQIHTHMCYSEFNDIIDAIAALDADVISIEAVALAAWSCSTPSPTSATRTRSAPASTTSTPRACRRVEEMERAARPGRAARPRRPALGQPRLRPEDPHLGRDPAGLRNLVQATRNLRKSLGA